MADASERYAVRTLLLGASEWTPIVTPFPCDYLCLWTTEAAWVRSDKDEPGTEKDLPAGSQEVILAPIGFMLSAPPRFKRGDVVFYMKAKGAESKISITFIY